MDLDRLIPLDKEFVPFYEQDQRSPETQKEYDQIRDFLDIRKSHKKKIARLPSGEQAKAFATRKPAGRRDYRPRLARSFLDGPAIEGRCADEDEDADAVHEDDDETEECEQEDKEDDDYGSMVIIPSRKRKRTEAVSSSEQRGHDDGEEAGISANAFAYVSELIMAMTDRQVHKTIAVIADRLN